MRRGKNRVFLRAADVSPRMHAMWMGRRQSSSSKEDTSLAASRSWRTGFRLHVDVELIRPGLK